MAKLPLNTQLMIAGLAFVALIVAMMLVSFVLIYVLGIKVWHRIKSITSKANVANLATSASKGAVQGLSSFISSVAQTVQRPKEQRDTHPGA